MKTSFESKSFKFMAQPLNVVVVAADADRLLALKRTIRELGHEVALPGQASVVLADGIESPHDLPAVQLGFSGFQSEGMLPGDASPDQIDAALRAVAAGLRVTALSHGSFGGFEEEHPVLLTPREMEVLAALSKGLSNKEIGRRLGISLHTVKFHLESLMRKLETSSRTETVIKAMGLGLLELLRV